MTDLNRQLQDKYAHEVETIETIGPAEITITLKPNVDAATFSQNLQDHLIEIIDQQSIIKIGILDHNRQLADSFATNQ